MADITLYEGNNVLNVQLAPIVPGYVILYPNGDGDLTEIHIPPGPPHWSIVRDYDGNYLTEDQGGTFYYYKDLYTIPPSDIPDGARIEKVVFCAWYKYDYSIGYRGDIAPIIKYNGVVSATGGMGSFAHHDYFDWQYDEIEEPVSPLTGEAWTLDEINGMQIGVGMIKGFAPTAYSYLDQFFVKVYYH